MKKPLMTIGLEEITCKVCSGPLDGKMIFYPEICLGCVIDLDINDKKKLKKNEKST
jgi:hypothetical protein|tara:strand:+ start:4855 stop:5022 length:168 start_codon:yes stop_codon:yes gene_type:complete